MFIDLINKRRSVRSYLSKSVPQELIIKCIEAARLAPSACNSQPWKFVVADEAPLKDRLCDAAFSGMFSMNKFAKEAPVIIAVVAQRPKLFARVGGFVRNIKFHLMDIGIACEHLILQAEELGIGSCWLGWFNEDAVKKILNIPRDKKVEVLISLGYAKDAEQREKNREPLDRIFSFNRYGRP